MSALLQCGCCWSFASVAVAECLNNMANKNITSLSEQQLIDCDHKPPYVDGGCKVSCTSIAVGSRGGWSLELLNGAPPG